MGYDAFVSYSHADTGLARHLQRALQRLAKPWYRVRVLRVFLDDASLSANPDLWSSIESAVDESEWMLLLASPPAARSKWVDRELEHWLATKSSKRIIIVLTDGTLEWDTGTNELVGTAVPPVLRQALRDEPRHVDLRWAHDESDVDLRTPRFRDTVADIGAPIHGIPKDELDSEDIRLHRRATRLARSGVALIAMLLVLSVLFGSFALVQRNRADDRAAAALSSARTAEIGRINALAHTLPVDQLDLALLLGVEGVGLRRDVDSESALEAALNHAPRDLKTLVAGTDGFPSISADGHELASVERSGDVRVVDPADGHVIARLHGAHPAVNVSLNPSGTVVTAGSADGVVSVWTLATGQLSGAEITPGGKSVSGFLDPADPSGLFTVSDDGAVEHWDRHDPEHPRMLGQFAGPPPAGTLPLFTSVSDDGSLLAVSNDPFADNASTTIWDVATQQQLQILPGTSDMFEPGNSTLLLSNGQHVEFRDARTGALDGAPLETLDLALTAAFSPDGKRFAVGDGQLRIKVYDAATRTVVATLATGAVPVSFLSDGRLMTWAPTGTELWTIDGPGPVATSVRADVNDYVEPHFVSNGAVVWGTSPTDAVLFWDATTGAPSRDLLPGVVALDVSRDGRLVLSSLAGGGIGVWDVAAARQVGTIDTRAARLTSRSSRQMAGPSSQRRRTRTDQTLTLWNLADLRTPQLTGTLVAPGILPAGASMHLRPTFSPDGRSLVVQDTTLGMITGFDVGTRQRRWTDTLTAGQCCREGSISPDGSTYAVIELGAGSTSVAFLDMGSGAQERTMPAQFAFGVVYANGGRFIATTGTLPDGHGGLQLYDAATLAQIGEPLENTSTFANFADTSSDGSHVTAGSDSGEITVWTVDPDLWVRAACTLAGRNLTRAEWSEYLPDLPYHTSCPQWPDGT